MRNYLRAKRRPDTCACPVVPCSSPALHGGRYCQYCREQCLPDWERRRHNRAILLAVIVIGPILAALATWGLCVWGI